MEDRLVSRRSSILLGERRTTNFQRFAAKGIDIVVVVAIYLLGKAIWFPLGSIAAAVFAAFQDSMGNGQSIGKKIIGLCVIDDATGMHCAVLSSFLRNVPLVIAILFACVPALWAFALFVAIPVLVLEIYLLLSIDCGVRLGDVIGNTLVTEYVDELPGS